MKNMLPILFLIQLVGCLPPTKEESKLINQLNDQYTDVEFSIFRGIEDVYVKLKIKTNRIDSTRLKDIYHETMKMNLDSLGNPRTNWLYIIVYDTEGKYLFTMRDYRGKFNFFRDDVF